MPIDVSKQILERLKRLRETGLRARREIFSHENFRESHARELIARTVILPQLKAHFGGRLKAVLLVGSSQLGVRKASLKRQKSDIDVVVAVSRNNPHLGMYEPLLICRELSEEVERMAGCPCQIMPVFDTNFKPAWSALKAPFQVLFGGKWVYQQLGEEHIKEIRANRGNMALKEKYKPKRLQRSMKNPL